MFKKTTIGIAGALGLAMLGSTASAVTVFGSKLNHQLTGPQACAANASHICSWVLTTAQNNAGHERAPHDGTITQIKLMACGPGSFIMQIARAAPATHQARVIRTGPLINYVGSNARNCIGSSNFFIETFKVSIPVKTGDFLAVAASRVNFNYSSGDREDVFDPPLPDGGPFRTTNNTGLGSGLLMMQAVMTP